MITILIYLIFIFFFICHILGRIVKRINNRPMDPKWAAYLHERDIHYRALTRRNERY